MLFLLNPDLETLLGLSFTVMNLWNFVLESVHFYFFPRTQTYHFPTVLVILLIKMHKISYELNYLGFFHWAVWEVMAFSHVTVKGDLLTLAEEIIEN